MGPRGQSVPGCAVVLCAAGTAELRCFLSPIHRGVCALHAELSRLPGSHLWGISHSGSGLHGDSTGEGKSVGSGKVKGPQPQNDFMTCVMSC